MNQQELEQGVEARLRAQLTALPAGPSVTDITTAVDALAKAIDDMPDGQSPQDARLAAVWQQSGRFQINRWTGDLGRSLHGVAHAIEDVKANPLPPAGVDAIENALWRLDTGRERIKTIACLALGVTVVTLIPNRTNVAFKVDGKALGRTLTDLASTHPSAGPLNAVLEQLWGHDATNRRNEVTHGLTQVADVPPLFYFQLARVRQRQIESWETRSYHSNSAPFQAGNLTLSAILRQTYTAIVEAFDLEIQAVNLLAQLVQSAARLEPWYSVFYDEDTGVATLTDPRTTGFGDPWPPAKG